MPIVDVELVCVSEAEFRSVSAAAVAQAVGRVLSSPPGRVWVRLRRLDRECYAENEVLLSAAELPVFVTVLHAQLPVAQSLSAEVVALTNAVAAAVGRPEDRVHVQYAPLELVAKHSEVSLSKQAPNPSIERTFNSWLRHLLPAAHVKR